MTTTKQKPVSKKTPGKKDQTRESVKKPEKNKLRIQLIRSPIGYPSSQRAVIRGLGLRKLNSQVIREDSPEVRGMIMKISHLVQVEANKES